MSLLEVEDLRVRFPSAGGVEAVRGVSLRVEPGEIVGIVGESGSGKSLTALSIAQLAPRTAEVSAKRLHFSGTDLLSAPRRELDELLSTRLAMIFQDPMTALNPALTIGTQVGEAARVHLGASRTQARANVAARLADVGIPSPETRASQYPHEFSGGMRQRAMIAMGLMVDTELIVADEPTTALDVTVQAQVLDVLQEVNRRTGVAVLLISHDIVLVSRVCQRVLVMYGGRIVEQIDAADLLTTPRHPYTQALISSVPTLTTPRDRPLTTIPGEAPAPGELGAGCVYAGRCPYASDRSREQQPPSFTLGPTHRVACWLSEQEAVDA